MSRTRGPGSPNPKLPYSLFSTPYSRFAKITVVTFIPARAIVHKACAVYIPLPSADKHNTRRSGHAAAAPTASGIAIPIDPPVFAKKSCGGHPRVAGINPRPEVIDSSITIAFSGSSAPIACEIF